MCSKPRLKVVQSAHCRTNLYKNKDLLHTYATKLQLRHTTPLLYIHMYIYTF